MMKSAYELAMERLEKESGPTRKLTAKQKTQIADIEKTYEAKVAQVKLEYDSRIKAAQSMEEYEALRSELAAKIAALEEKREQEKETVWNVK